MMYLPATVAAKVLEEHEDAKVGDAIASSIASRNAGIEDTKNCDMYNVT